MAAQTEKLWDPVVRLSHWLLAFVFVANYFVNEQGDDWHQWLGYTAVACVVIRFFWGFFGTRAARWSDFFPTPARLLQHARLLACGQNFHRMGHSPIGGLVMILMLLCILGLGTTGYMMQEIDRFWGVEWLETLHETIANVLLGLVIIHIGAALFLSYRFRENLPLSMVTGRRRKP